MTNRFVSIFGVLLTVCLALVIYGCDDCDKSSDSKPFTSVSEVSSNEELMKGAFVDSNVAGLDYICDSTKDVTTSNGMLECINEKTVTFSVGNVTLGSAKCDKIITPASFSDNKTVVQNVVRFLQMLDSDQNVENGISISQDVRQDAEDWGEVNFSSTKDFENRVNKEILPRVKKFIPNASLPDTNSAMSHFENSFYCAYSGIYKGEYSGFFNGDFYFVIPSKDEVFSIAKTRINAKRGAVYGFVLEGIDLENSNGVLTNGSQMEICKKPTFHSNNSAKNVGFYGMFNGVDFIEGEWLIDNKDGFFSATRVDSEYELDTVYRLTGVAFSDSTFTHAPMVIDILPKNKAIAYVYEINMSEDSVESYALYKFEGTVSKDGSFILKSSGSELKGVFNNVTLEAKGKWLKDNETVGSFNVKGCVLNNPVDMNIHTSGTLKWKVGFDWPIYLSSAIGPDGTVYVFKNTATTLCAVSPDGVQKWEYKTNGRIESSPAVDSEGTVYFGSLDGYLYAINPNGRLKWKNPLTDSLFANFSSPAIGADGTIYIGACCYFYAVGSDGRLKWRFDNGRMVQYSSPAVASDGTIYFGADDGYLYALNSDGSMKWKYKTEKAIDSSPSIDRDGTIYIGSDDHYLYALYPDGTLKWKYKTNDKVKSSASIGLDGTVYIGSLDGYLYALNPDGTLKWKYKTKGGIYSTVAIGSCGVIYVGSIDRYIYALYPDGTLKWKYKTDADICASASVDSSGIVYIGSRDKNLYAIYSSSNGLINSAWPKFRHDNRNTAKIAQGK